MPCALSSGQTAGECGRIVRWCLVNFQCRGRPFNLNNIGTRTYCAWSRCGWGCWDIFLSVFSLFYIPLWETVRYRLKYCLKGPFNSKQPTNVTGWWWGGGGGGEVHKSHQNSGAQIDNTMPIPVCCLISRNV